jgi:hypothetical protein
VDPSDVFPLPVSEGVVEMVSILFTRVPSTSLRCETGRSCRIPMRENPTGAEQP